MYRYDDAWERDASDALSAFFTFDPASARDAAPCVAGDCAHELIKALVAKPNTQVLDFRRAADFDAFHLPSSVNMPLRVLAGGAARGSPFADPVGDCAMLEELWLELETLFTVQGKYGARNPSAEALMTMLRGKRILTVCYDGDSARVANSVLRAKGVDSVSVGGGVAALARLRLPETWSSQKSTRVVFVEA